MKKVRSMEELTVITDAACDELTIEHILIGVSKSSSNEAISLETNDAKEEQKQAAITGAKKKRESKKQKKGAEVVPLSKTASEAVSAESPLRLNYSLFVAQERRDAVLAFAERKFAVPAGRTDEN